MHDELSDASPPVGRRRLLRLTGAAAAATTAAMMLGPAEAVAGARAGRAGTRGEPGGSAVRDEHWRQRAEQIRAHHESVLRSAELTRQRLGDQTALRIPAGPPR
ncbi:MAG TPA: hypothetical protein VFV66_30640 [Nonomuraea sp.]|nr:hypothetical protein [Nonomuraea sp.]